ncbi:HPGDS [Mytilus edulis]|uniref:HPGDS n=1 Tax=Mytilus edulis TaxID=6550 RepID=A0A8S3SE82_MYTED|nr:HPGDS [Mytilus edulis]
MPAKYKLSYFEERGRAEILRLLFAGAGQEFEDERLTGDSWAAFKPNNNDICDVQFTFCTYKDNIQASHVLEKTPYGQMPMLTIDSKTMINQTGAIARFIAREFEYGKKLNTEVLPKYFAFMAKLLNENGGKYLVGSKLSLADLAFFDMLDKITGSKVMGADLYKDFDGIKTFYENVQKLPKIKSYLEKRLPSDL